MVSFKFSIFGFRTEFISIRVTSGQQLRLRVSRNGLFLIKKSTASSEMDTYSKKRFLREGNPRKDSAAIWGKVKQRSLREEIEEDKRKREGGSWGFSSMR